MKQALTRIVIIIGFIAAITCAYFAGLKLSTEKSAPPVFERFAIYSTSLATILLDKATGQTFRQVSCTSPSAFDRGFKFGKTGDLIENFKQTNIPNCWQKMNIEEGDAPSQEIKSLKDTFTEGYEAGFKHAINAENNAQKSKE